MIHLTLKSIHMLIYNILDLTILRRLVLFKAFLFDK